MEVINTSKSNGKRGGQFDDHGHSETVTFLSPESSVDPYPLNHGSLIIVITTVGTCKHQTVYVASPQKSRMSAR